MLCCSPLTLCQALGSHARTGAGCSLSPGKQVRHVAEHAALVTGWQASTSCFLQGLQLKRWMLPLLQWGTSPSLVLFHHCSSVLQALIEK